MRTILNKISRKLNKWTEKKADIPIQKGISLERIGTPYGGWIIPDGTLRTDSVCYLVGAGEDISFDLGVSAKYGCPVHIFDPTPRAIAHVENVRANLLAGKAGACATSPGGFYPLYPPGIAHLLHLHPFGIWDNDTVLRFYAPRENAHVSHSLVNLQKTERYIEVDVRRLSSVMKDLKHKRIDLLKIDTEGAEYQIINSILTDQLEVDILCVEFDESASNHMDRNYIDRIKESIKSLLEADYVVVAKEPNCHNYTLLHQRRL